jgi:hypothetical protein
MAAACVLTLVVAAAWVFKVDLAATTTGVPGGLLAVTAGFAALFCAASLRLGRRAAADQGAENRFRQAALPAISVLPPFALLVMMVLRLNVIDPSPVFAVSLLLVALALGLARALRREWLPAGALAGAWLVTAAWAGWDFYATRGANMALLRENGMVAHPLAPPAWFAVFAAAVAAFPFVFRNQFLDARGPWVASAAALAAWFPLMHSHIGRHFPGVAPGLVPLAFAAPAACCLLLALRAGGPAHPRRNGRLALYGGVTLLFLTLVAPVQWSRQWVTLGWALEGVALLWLFHRVPHRGLPVAGALLLAVAFARLALNPAVLAYAPRGEWPVLNWYLYTYGIAAACLFAGARLLAPPRGRVAGISMPPLLGAGGVILLFLLLNIEIADYFTPPGARAVALGFSGDFARDMTYTIAWALFALILFIYGIWRRNRGARWPAMALLGVVLIKLFFHDLARLDNLYRVGALLGVAVIAIAASFIYQKFLRAGKP